MHLRSTSPIYESFKCYSRAFENMKNIPCATGLSDYLENTSWQIEQMRSHYLDTLLMCNPWQYHCFHHLDNAYTLHFVTYGGISI